MSEIFNPRGLAKAAEAQYPIGSKIRALHPYFDVWVDGEITGHYLNGDQRNGQICHPQAVAWLSDAHLTNDGTSTSGVIVDIFEIIAERSEK